MPFLKTILIGINQSKLTRDDYKRLDTYCPKRVFIERDATVRV